MATHTTELLTHTTEGLTMVTHTRGIDHGYTHTAEELTMAHLGQSI